ncbi:hypothetical protein ACTXT7_001839 [Hymenolepis weldensis]
MEAHATSLSSIRPAERLRLSIAVIGSTREVACDWYMKERERPLVIFLGLFQSEAVSGAEYYDL